MIGTVAGLTLQLGAIALMAAGIISNRLDPSYESALAVPVFNALAIVLALLGLASAALARRRNRDLALANYAVLCGSACAIALILLFPFANAGSFSAVN